MSLRYWAVMATAGVLAWVSCARDVEDMSCPGCSIEMESVVTIGGTGDSGSFPTWPRLSRDSRGRFYGITPDRAGVPAVFDSTGRFLRSLGSSGQGPGEYGWPRAVLTVGDSIYVLDGNARLTVLNSDLAVARTAMIQGFAMAYDVTLAFGNVLVLDVPGAGATPLHSYDLDGNSVAKFGDPEQHCPGCQAPVHVLGIAGTDELWTARRFYEYRLDRWDRTGTRLAGATIESPWFAPYDSMRALTPDQPPQAWVGGVWEDERGLVWVTGRTVGSRWDEGLGEPLTREAGHRYYPVVDPRAVYDGIIEVVDPVSWEVIARRRLDEHWWLVPVGAGMIASIRETEDGWWVADVYRVELVGLEGVQ